MSDTRIEETKAEAENQKPKMQDHKGKKKQQIDKRPGVYFTIQHKLLARSLRIGEPRAYRLNRVYLGIIGYLIGFGFIGCVSGGIH